MAKPSKPILYIGFVFGVILLIASYFYQQSKPVKGRLNNFEFAKTLTIYNVEMKEYNEQGILEQTLLSNKIEHINNKSNILSNPKVNFQKNQSPAQITADIAITRKNGKLIIFKGNVTIVQYENKNIISQLNTSKLYYYPKSNTIKTTEKVKYINHDLVIYSKGLQANLNTEIINLQSRTKGIYHGKVS